MFWCAGNAMMCVFMGSAKASVTWYGQVRLTNCATEILSFQSRFYLCCTDLFGISSKSFQYAQWTMWDFTWARMSDVWLIWKSTWKSCNPQYEKHGVFCSWTKSERCSPVNLFLTISGTAIEYFVALLTAKKKARMYHKLFPISKGQMKNRL